MRIEESNKEDLFKTRAFIIASAQAQQERNAMQEMIDAKDPQGNACLDTYAWKHIKDILSESRIVQYDNAMFMKSNVAAEFTLSLGQYDGVEQTMWTLESYDDAFSTHTRQSLLSIGIDIVDNGLYEVCDGWDSSSGPDAVNVYLCLQLKDEDRFNEFLDDLIYEHS